MTPKQKTLAKNPALEPAQDFYRLRREGIGFIEQMASAAWTDYNLHDPGITLLEALCYAITDLAYRSGWDIRDILSPENASSDPLQPYPKQAFFTARDILTVNPVTTDDFRRLLIDLPKVRNAWVLCKACACEVRYDAWCDKDALQLSYAAPASVTPVPQEVWARGLYESLLELDADPELGDLNDRKIEHQTVFHDDAGAHATLMELRFPQTALSSLEAWQLFLGSDDAFADEALFTLRLTQLGASKAYDLFGDEPLNEAKHDDYVRKHWRSVFYLSLEIGLLSSGAKIVIENASLRLFGDAVAKTATTAQGLKALLEDRRASGFIRRYRQKAQQALAAIKSAKAALQAHRNLDEDYCRIQIVGIEEVAVCADVQVRLDADIEWVQARIWFEIEQYFNPAVRFHTLQEMLDADVPAEDIFNGPALAGGFIKAADLQAASLKTVLRVSDLINRLMDIDGVIAVNQLQLTSYDAEGQVIKGVADPAWVDGQPVFDSRKASASWLMFFGAQHQPRLYRQLSRFLFYKNGLAFLPRMDEAADTLNQLRGEADRPKNDQADNDLKIPTGRFRHPQEYYPLQYSFPETYGIGPGDLPSHATALRRAQARQLKAYLMVFEQIIGNALAQLAHTADLFSLDPGVTRTYFVQAFSEASIHGFDEISSGLDAAALEAMAETVSEFQERRNRFLDHLLARFGEQFSEYALLLSRAEGRQAAQGRLIADKLAFLARCPQIGHDRARAFDYTLAPCSEYNNPGIKKRIGLLLGHPDLAFAWSVADLSGGTYQLDFQLVDQNASSWLDGRLTLSAGTPAAARQQAYRAVIGQMIRPDAYDIASEGGSFRPTLKDKAVAPLGQHPALFDRRADAQAMQDELLAWSANARMIVVEHLLLRPKFVGDALYPACSDGACVACGDEDPYSFRLTFVMPGWSRPYAGNLELRRFAERTLQQETPSHLLGKTCWVGNEGFVENSCDDVIGELAGLLMAKGLTAAGSRPDEAEACACASALYHAFSAVFASWYADRTLDFIHPDALATLIAAQFSAAPKPSDMSCSTVLDAPLWAEVQAAMVRHFVAVALSGWQFERFETAWCRWLDANAGFDWMDERLQERVQAMLEVNLITAPVKPADLCRCAAGILTDYGLAFYGWMDDNLKAGHALEDFPEFAAPAIGLCDDMRFRPGTDEAIGALLAARYGAYREVSYRLWRVVNLLAGLRNIYPGATLHDCDDGSDHNPVRLDNTALGNYPLRTPLA